MRDALELTLINVRALTLRAVAGHGEQAELTITTARGALTIRLLARQPIRFTDLRRRARARRAAPLVTVPFPQTD